MCGVLFQPHISHRPGLDIRVVQPISTTSPDSETLGCCYCVFVSVVFSRRLERSQSPNTRIIGCCCCCWRSDLDLHTPVVQPISTTSPGSKTLPGTRTKNPRQSDATRNATKVHAPAAPHKTNRTLLAAGFDLDSIIGEGRRCDYNP